MFILNCIGISVVQSALAVLAVSMLFQSIPNLNFSPLHAHRVSEAILGICSFAQCSRAMAPRSSAQPPPSKKPRTTQDEDEIMFEDLNTDDGVSTNNSDSTLPLDGKSVGGNSGQKGKRKSAGSSGGAAGLGTGICMMPRCALEQKDKSRWCVDHQTHYDMLRYKKAKEFGNDEAGKAKLKEWVQKMKDWCCSACLCFFCFVLCSLIR